MRSNKRSITKALARAARLRCPACGLSSIFSAPFKRRRYCPACAATFEREEGYFVGAVSINLVTTELVLILVYVACLLTVGFNERLIFFVLLPVGLLFPALFYHHSWGAWLGFDHFFEPLPKFAEGSRGGANRANGPGT